MTLEQNKALARRELEELWSEGHLAVADEIFAPNFVSHQHSRPDAQDVHGLEAYKAFVGQVHEAFPDLHYVLEDQIAEGDKVMTRNVASGTHKGWLMGIEPTNKRAQWAGISIDRIEHGKIVENWVSWDMMGMLQQLGVVSLPSQEGR
jgi:predicted ester cyclase